MNSKLTVFYLETLAEYREALDLLVTARVASSAIHSSMILRMDVLSWHDEQNQRLVIDSSSKAGKTLVRILTALLDHHIGRSQYTVCPAMTEDVERVCKWKRCGCAG
jgi:hypothetical protein